MRIGKNEALAHQAGVVIEGRAVDEPEAFRVDEHLRAIGPVEYLVAVPRTGLPGEGVAQSRAAASLDSDAEPAVRKPVLLGHFPDELPRVLCDLHHVREVASDIRPL